MGGKIINFLLICPRVSYSYVSTNEEDKSFKGLAPPLGLLYIGTILENDGNKISIIDFSAENFESKKLINSLNGIDAVGISVFSFALDNTLDIIKIIKDIHPEIKIIIGGPHCKLFPEKSLKETNADVCVYGDGESVILDIKKAINGEIKFSDIPGIYYKEKNKIYKGDTLKLIENLDSISYPSRHFVEKYVYGNQFYPKIKKGEFTSIITSRGCPYKCSFCSRNSVSMRTYRARSANDILKEIKYLKKNGYKYIAFVDDCFLSNKNQTYELFDKIIEEKLDMKFIITATRVDSADEKLFLKMKQAGVTHMQFGLESGNQEILDFYNKKTNLEKIRNAVNLSHKIGFFNMGSFILGAPFETKEQFDKTIEFAKSLPLDSVSFVPLKYMAGSDLWLKATREGKISEDVYVSRAGSERRLGLYSEKYIVNYCIKAREEYYRSPKFFIRLLLKSIKNDDLGFLQSYLTMFFSNISEGLKFLGLKKPS